MSSPWTLLLLCCCLGTLTAAFPSDQSKKDLQDEDDILSDVRLQPQTSRSKSLERHVQQYQRAAVNLAERDLFPTHLCEAAALNRMRRALRSLPDGEIMSAVFSDSVLRALLMVTHMQSEGCREGALHTATKLRDLIKTTTPQQPRDVITETGDVASKDSASTDDSEEKKGRQGTREAGSHCLALGECRRRGIHDVRTIMAEEPDLLLLYNAMATAVFRASGRSKLAQALHEDLLDDLQGKRPSRARHLHPRSKRFTERDFEFWVGLLPDVGVAYDFASAAVYACQGNYDMARSRLASGTLGLLVPKSLKPVTRYIPSRFVRWGVEAVARKGVEKATGFK